MFTAEMIRSLAETSPLQSGVDASFFPINDRWGFKFFYEEHPCNLTYRAQQYAHKNGLAPAVGLRYNLKDGRSTTYGYLTERVASLMYDEYNVENADSRIDTWNEYVKNVRNPIQGRLSDLFGVGMYDQHWRNVGRLHNNNIVSIDFSELVMASCYLEWLLK